MVVSMVAGEPLSPRAVSSSIAGSAAPRTTRSKLSSMTTIQHRAMTQPALRRVGPRWTELRDAPPVGTVGSWLSWWSVVSVIVMSLSVRGAVGGL